MKARILFLFLMMASPVLVMAQKYVVSGNVANAQSSDPIEFATAALLRSDSTVVTGVMTDRKGKFRINAREAGQYILKVSFMGFKTTFHNLQLTKQAPVAEVGMVKLSTNEQLLKTAIIKATAAKVEQKEDTTIFNASAYRVPEGSTLEALVKQLPGVEIEDDGSVTWNGKKVKELLVNGKDFFKGDKDVAMKNLPTEMVSKVKAYDKRSDYAEMTGIDDGQEKTVLDIMTKRELNESLVSNIDFGYGTEDRYTGKAFVSYFTDRSRVSAYGSLNNVNNRGFGGYRGFGSNGLTAHKDAGVDFVWENDKEKRAPGKLELGGSVNYAHVSTDKVSSSSSETFLSSGRSSSFSNSLNYNGSSSTNVNTNFNLQWNPDSLTQISFRPSYSYSESKNNGNSLTATFNDDPFSLENMFSPLDSIFNADANDELEAITVNKNKHLSLGDSKSNNVNGELNIMRRLSENGRNVSFRANGGYSENENNSFSISHIQYFNGTAPSYLNQYSNTPSKNWNYSLNLGYVEPITKNLFAEVRYTFAHKYNDSDRSRYNLEQIINDPNNVWNNPDNFPAIGTLPTSDELLNAVRDLHNSQYATYKYTDHTANVGIRYNSQAIRFNAGVSLNPEETKMEYLRPGQNIDTLITRNVFNVSPQVRFRYRFSPTSNLDIRYSGSPSQPSMTNLLAVVDNSNPLNISMGNPGLKPSWTNNLSANFYNYNPMMMQGIGGGLNFSQTKNSVSNLLVYDEATGVRYTRPENINGNWNTRAYFMINQSVGPEKNFTISNFTNLSYNNSVGYVSSFDSDKRNIDVREMRGVSSYDFYDRIFDNADVEKNTTRNFMVRENMRLGYRNEWFDVGLLGRVNYNHARSELQDKSNMDTWNFSYGANANLNFDWGMSFSTDISMSSRRGFSESSMNTNELLWNAQISQSFLKNKAATLSLQFYDILQEQSNVSRTVNAMMRSDSWTNAINSYCMIHFIYKLNIFGGGKSGKEDSFGGGYGRQRGQGGGRYGRGGGGYHGSGHGGRF